MTALHPERLIQVAFTLREASAECAHEESIRHRHISTLHIWRPRRPSPPDVNRPLSPVGQTPPA